MARADQNKKESTEYLGPIDVVMTETKQASPNGYQVLSFFKGQRYTLTPQLARALEGCFEIVNGQNEEPPNLKNEMRPANKAAMPRENK